MPNSHISSEKIWVPLVYYAQGIPFIFINLFVLLFFQFLGLTNSKNILIVSLLTLPWTLKPFISPFLEIYFSKKHIACFTQCLIGLTFLLLALIPKQANGLTLFNFLFFLIAFLGSSHDIATDGLYLEQLDNHQKKFFIGIRNIFYQAGKITVSYLSFILIDFFSHKKQGIDPWSVIFFLLSLIYFIISSLNYYLIPDDFIKRKTLKLKIYFFEIFSQTKKEIPSLAWLFFALVFIVIFNIPESQAIKIIPLYLASHNNHIPFSYSQIGVYFGFLGTCGFILGSLCFSFLSQKFSYQKIMLYSFFILTLLYLVFVVISNGLVLNRSFILVTIIMHQFFYGLSNSAYMYSLMELTACFTIKMTIYAIATSVMLLGFSIGGLVLSYFQRVFAFPGLFLEIYIMSLVFFFVYIALFRQKFNFDCAERKN